MALGLHLLGTPAARAARSANERVRVGFIGVGNRGTQLLHGFMAQDDVDIVALCDVYEPSTGQPYNLENPAIEGVKKYMNFLPGTWKRAEL